MMKRAGVLGIAALVAGAGPVCGDGGRVAMPGMPAAATSAICDITGIETGDTGVVLAAPGTDRPVDRGAGGEHPRAARRGENDRVLQVPLPPAVWGGGSLLIGIIVVRWARRMMRRQAGG
jgi:hypothetical protein